MKKIINNPVLVGSGAVLAWTVWGNVSWGFWPLLILAVSLTIWFVATVATVVRQVGVEEKLSSGWFIVFAVILFLACVVGAFFEIDLAPRLENRGKINDIWHSYNRYESQIGGVVAVNTVRLSYFEARFQKGKENPPFWMDGAAPPYQLFAVPSEELRVEAKVEVDEEGKRTNIEIVLHLPPNPDLKEATIAATSEVLRALLVSGKTFDPDRSLITEERARLMGEYWGEELRKKWDDPAYVFWAALVYFEGAQPGVDAALNQSHPLMPTRVGPPPWWAW